MSALDQDLLRPVRETDLARLAEISAQWETSMGWTPAQYRAELSSQRSVGLVIESAGRVAGYAFLWVVAGEGQVADIAVERAASRRGLGRRLLRALLEEARRRGCTEATLEVSADNPGALALYRSEGFAIVGRRAKIYNGVSDAVLMSLTL